MDSSTVYNKYCTEGKYFGQLRHGNFSESNDAINPDEVAQTIFSLAYIVVILMATIACFVAVRSSIVRKHLSSGRGTVFLVTFGVFVILGKSSEPNIRVHWYTEIIVGITTGVIFLVLGHKVFFTGVADAVCAVHVIEENNPLEGSDFREESGSDRAESVLTVRDIGARILPLGVKYPKIEYVTGFLTFCIITIELIFLVTLAAYMPCDACTEELATLVVSISQKITQTLVYALLCKKVAKTQYLNEASWYLKIIGFINFSFWFGSLAFGPSMSIFTAARAKLGDSIMILQVLYEALLADYRLLSGVLFIEHAITTESTQGNVTESVEGKENSPDNSTFIATLTIEGEYYRYLGYLVGCFIIGLEVVKNLQHVTSLGLPGPFRLIGIATDLFLMVSVSIFLRRNPSRAAMKMTGVTIMVACMGVTGLCYWMFKSVFNLHLLVESFEDDNFSEWSSLLDGVKALSLFFLIILFLRTSDDVNVVAEMNKTSHFLITALPLSVLANFIGCIMDFHQSVLDKTIICKTYNPNLLLLFNASPPLYLGFCLHLFAKLFIMSHQKALRHFVSKKTPSSSLEEPLLRDRSPSDICFEQ